MEIRRFICNNGYGTNAYLAWDTDTKKAFLVDPGSPLEDVPDAVEQYSLDLQYMIITHGHGDHTGGIDFFKEQFPDIKMVACRKERKMLQNRDISGGKGGYKADLEVVDGDTIMVGSLLLKFIECPGHTPGGMSILVDKVLFSGDTGFYSGTKSLLKALDKDVTVEILPGIGSLAWFCARLRRPWEDVRAVSLHGRNCDLVREVRENPAVFTLLGGDTGAKEALERLKKAGLGDLRAYVGENLGYADERISSGTVAKLLEGEYGSLCVLLVENDRYEDTCVTYGLPDEAFDRDKVPMTKEEVRSVCVSKLALTRGAVVYDVGSGSGSVSVECARVASRGKVYAIEQKDSAIALTKQNADKFGLVNLEVVPGTAPEALIPLEAPTHAFIGGSSGNLRQITDLLLEKNPGVRIVATAVTLETVAELTDLCNEFEYSDIAEVQVNKPRKVGRYHLSNAQNPVYIFTFQHKK